MAAVVGAEAAEAEEEAHGVITAVPMEAVGVDGHTDIPTDGTMAGHSIIRNIATRILMA